MITIISQPRFLPSNSYMERFILADQFVYLDTDQYSPRDWENRNRIHNGKNHIWLTVPVLSKTKKFKIKDVRIDNTVRWQRKILNTLFHCYGKKEHFESIYSTLEKNINQENEFLCELNISIIKEILKKSNIECNITRSSDLEVSKTGNQALIYICNKTKTTHYISGINGINYLDGELWKKSGIDVSIQHFSEKVHLKNTRVKVEPYLSCIDLLFNVGFSDFKNCIENSSQIKPL